MRREGMTERLAIDVLRVRGKMAAHRARELGIVAIGHAGSRAADQQHRLGRDANEISRNASRHEAAKAAHLDLAPSANDQGET